MVAEFIRTELNCGYARLVFRVTAETPTGELVTRELSFNTGVAAEDYTPTEEELVHAGNVLVEILVKDLVLEQSDGDDNL